MSIRSVLENNPLVLVAGVAVVSGGVVAGVMDYFHGTELDQIERDHGLKTTRLEDRISTLTTQLEERDAGETGLRQSLRDRELIEKFKSLHARILTYASVNPECQLFDRGFGGVLSGAEWDIAALASDYRAVIADLEERELARVAVSRAGPSNLVFEEGGAWPIAAPSRCTAN